MVLNEKGYNPSQINRYPIPEKATEPIKELVSENAEDHINFERHLDRFRKLAEEEGVSLTVEEEDIIKIVLERNPNLTDAELDNMINKNIISKKQVTIKTETLQDDRTKILSAAKNVDILTKAEVVGAIDKTFKFLKNLAHFPEDEIILGQNRISLIKEIRDAQNVLIAKDNESNNLKQSKAA